MSSALREFISCWKTLQFWLHSGWVIKEIEFSGLKKVIITLENSKYDHNVVVEGADMNQIINNFDDAQAKIEH